MEQTAKPYLDLLKQEIFTARIEWRLYKWMFGTNAETVEMLNEISGPTALTLDRVLFERTLLNLRKLTDAPENARRGTKSVSTKGLLTFFYPDDQELQSHIKQAEEAVGFARDWSNKRIAHSDLEYHEGAYVLENASREKVEFALNAIANVAKYVSRHYFDLTIVTHPTPPAKDERAFIKTLYLGQLARTNRAKLHKKYLDQRDYKSLGQMRNENKVMFPEWLEREEPPIDVD